MRILPSAAAARNQQAFTASFKRLPGGTSLLRSPVRNVLEARQSPRIRHHAMLHIEIPRCWKVCNDFCSGARTTFLNCRIGLAVILKSDADELSAGI